jgi:hypothetical protein
MKFYSKEEIATLKSVVRSGEKLPAAARRLSEELNRSQGSVYLKLLEVGKKMGVIKTKKPAKVVAQQSDKGVTLRNGFVFDFKPQRAEMFQDHVRIYF